MRLRRPLLALCAIAPLVLTASACSDSSGGLIMGTSANGRTQTIADPVQGRCTRFAGRGVTAVTNNTGVDIFLHQNANCTDPPGRFRIYLGTTLSTTKSPTQGPWLSFDTVGLTPPVPPNVATSPPQLQPRSPVVP